MLLSEPLLLKIPLHYLFSPKNFPEIYSTTSWYIQPVKFYTFLFLDTKHHLNWQPHSPLHCMHHCTHLQLFLALFVKCTLFLGYFLVFWKGCPENISRWKGWEIFLESRYSIKTRQSDEMVSVATKLEQYTCTCFINYLTFSWFFFKQKSSFFRMIY